MELPTKIEPETTDLPTTLQWRLERKSHGRLDCVDARGQRHADVDVLRAFPISAPNDAVALIAADGSELVWIETLTVIDPAVRAMLEAELASREFLPVIRSIESVSDGEPTEWHVITDRGATRFKVAHADDILCQSDSGAFITDTIGVRYRIPNAMDLDPDSRRRFEKSL